MFRVLELCAGDQASEHARTHAESHRSVALETAGDFGDRAAMGRRAAAACYVRAMTAVLVHGNPETR